MNNWKLYFFSIFLIPLLICVSIINTSEGADTDAVSVLMNIAQAREMIKSGHVSVEEMSNVVENKNAVQSQWDIFFDGSKLRADKKRGNSTETICLDCYSKYTRLYYSSAKPALPEMQNALTFYDGYGEPAIRFAIPNPRWIGYVPDSFLGTINTDPVLIYKFDYKKHTYSTRLSPDTFGGQECWKITFPSPLSSGQSVFTIWVDKNTSERIFRAECHLPAQEAATGIDYLERTDVQGEMVQGKYWFPTQVSHQRFENDKMTRSSITKIIVHSLNTPLPSDTFSPKSIVKPDTPVAWHVGRDRPVATRGKLVWDGNNVVARGTFELDKAMKESTRFKPLSVFFMLLGVALILFGIGMKLWKKYGT
jgi:hypothetical protein